MENKKYEREGTSPNINNGRSGRSRTGPKKQSKFSGYMQKIMLEMPVASVMDLN